jgi:serralysin
MAGLETSAGNDTYYVESNSDVITEKNNEGTDLVLSTANSYTLGSNVENLSLAGTGAFAGTGNTLANVIMGGSGADTLSGGAGSDSLNGGAGTDRLIGGADADYLTGGSEGDTFVFTAASDSKLSALDRIQDFTGEDVIDIHPLGLVDGPNDVLDKGNASPLTGNSNDFFKAGSTAYDVAYLINGTDTYVYIDVNGDGNFRTGQDMVIELVNFTGPLTDANFFL